MSQCELRAKSRTFFPNWPRRKRAQWVIRALQARAIGPRVVISADNCEDARHYAFARSDPGGFVPERGALDWLFGGAR